MSSSAREQLEAVLYQEARLIDERRFTAWLDLFTADAVYWVPAGGDAPDPARHVSIIYDDRQRLELRVERITSGRAFAQEPPSETCRAIANIEIVPAADGEFELRSVLTIAELRAGRQQFYMARCVHRLRHDLGWKIARKEVWLINRGETFDNLSLIL